MSLLKPTLLNSTRMSFLSLIPSSHLPHGEFGNWLKQNWEMEERIAQNYMSMAMLNPKRIADLTLITDALKLAKQEAKPKESK